MLIRKDVGLGPFGARRHASATPIKRDFERSRDHRQRCVDPYTWRFRRKFFDYFGPGGWHVTVPNVDIGNDGWWHRLRKEIRWFRRAFEGLARSLLSGKAHIESPAPNGPLPAEHRLGD